MPNKSLTWYNTQISKLDLRLRSSDFDYLQGFAVALDTMKTLQAEREKLFGVPAEAKKYTY
jgi:hypothetical protein